MTTASPDPNNATHHWRRCWNRPVALLIVLAVVKLHLLVAARAHIFEATWRHSPRAGGWPERLGLLLLATCLVVLGNRCSSICKRHSRRRTQTLALVCLFFAGLFHLSSSSQLNRHYLHALAAEALTFTDLRANLFLDCFDRSPYLIAFLLPLALGWLLLTRTGRDHLLPTLLGMLAALYLLIRFWNFPPQRNETAAILMLGLLGWLAALPRGFRPRRARPGGAQDGDLGGVPAQITFPPEAGEPASTSSAGQASPARAGELAESAKSFTPSRPPANRFATPAILLALAAAYVALAILIWHGTPVLARFPNLLVPHLAATLALGLLLWLLVARLDTSSGILLLPMVMATYFFYANLGYPLAATYSRLAIHFLCLGGYFAGDLLLVGLLAALYALGRRAAPKIAPLAFDLAATALIVLGCLEVMAFRLLDVRASWALLTMGDDTRLIWGVLAEFVTLGRVAGLATAMGSYWLLAWIGSCGLRKLERRHQPCRGRANDGDWAGAHARITAPAQTAAVLIVGLCLVGGWLHPGDQAMPPTIYELLKDMPWLKRLQNPRMDTDKWLAEGRELGLLPPPAHQVDEGRPPKDWNVVLIILESMHCQHLSLFGGETETQPSLRAYENRMDLFANFYSNFPNSNHARFAILNGLYPPRPYITHLNPRIPCPSLSEILHANGWTTSMFYSSHRHYTRLYDYLGHRRWDRFYDSSNLPFADHYPRVSWGVREEATLDSMTAELDTHAAAGNRFFMTYIPASPHRPFDGTPPEFRQFDEGFPTLTGNYLGRYRNQLLHMDWILATLIGHLETLGLLDRTLVVMTTDHGEMLGEDGGPIGHGWSVRPELCRVPLIVIRPGQTERRVFHTPGSHVDLLPTLLDLLDLPLPADELYQGVSLYNPPPEPRWIYLFSHQQRAILHDNHYLLEARSASRSTPPQMHPARIALDDTAATFIAVPLDAAPLSPAELANRLDRFEAFQHSLLLHYPTYRHPR